MDPPALDYNLTDIFRFMRGQMPGLQPTGGMRGIGLRRGGELVAGVLYEGINDFNLWMHVAATPGRHWLCRRFLRAAFAYPFRICGVRRVSGYVNDSNTDARRFNEHLGFTVEARLAGAASDGGDVLIYVMRREDCRYG